MACGAYRGRVPRSPLTLAALATVAVPGLDAYDVRRASHQGPGVDAAVVLDSEGRRWVVRAPQDAGAGAALEAEVVLLTALEAHVDAGRLPFEVPRPAGFAHLPEGGRAVVHRQLPGRPLQLELLGPGPGLAAALGRAIAALHELPHSTVEDAGLAVYEADAYRRRRQSEVDEAARTGLVPTALLRRWERALEDVGIWRFHPTVVHGDLSAEHVLCSAVAPVAVLGWSEAKVADPADDLAWLLVAAPQEAVDPILEAYTLRRTEMADRHLPSRALLAGELALARWLLHGVRTDDQEVVDDARSMLVELEEHTARVDPPPMTGWSLGGETADRGSAQGGPADDEDVRPESPADDERSPHESPADDERVPHESPTRDEDHAAPDDGPALPTSRATDDESSDVEREGSSSSHPAGDLTSDATAELTGDATADADGSGDEQAAETHRPDDAEETDDAQKPAAPGDVVTPA